MLNPLEDTRRLLALREKVQRWERTEHGDPATAHRCGVLAEYLVGLRALAGGCTDRIDGVLLAALALGPRIEALPGTGDLGPLLQAVETGGDAVDLAIAWGCGWGRVVVPEHEWHGRWVAALLSLSCLVAASVNPAVHWLEDRVRGVREALRRQGDRDFAERFDSHALHLAMELSNDACSCGRGGREAGPRGGCGRPEHRLVRWRPDDCRLQAFVATAVRGSSRPGLLAGAFATSMLLHLLREDRVVSVEQAEFHVCHACNADLILAARTTGGIELSKVTGGLHELNRCPACGALAVPGRTYQVARKNWLIVPDHWGGEYELVERQRCGCCGNLFAAGRDGCPLCRQPVPPRHRPTSVWVRRIGIGSRSVSTRGEADGS